MAVEVKPELQAYKRYFRSLEAVSKRQTSHIYSSVILSLLAISLFGWYAIKPTIQTIIFLRREIEDNKKVSRQMEEKIAKLIQAQAAYQAVQASLPLASQALPANPELVELANQLKHLALSVDASVSAIDAGEAAIIGDQTALLNKNEATTAANPKAPADVFQKVYDLPLLVAVVGPYKSVHAFLDGVTRMRRIATIKSMQISRDKINSDQNTSGEAFIRLNLQLTLHYINI